MRFIWVIAFAGFVGCTGGSGAGGATGQAGMTGPQGPKGDQGAPGAMGATGPVGPQGPAALAGVTCQVGQNPVWSGTAWVCQEAQANYCPAANTDWVGQPTTPWPSSTAAFLGGAALRASIDNCCTGRLCPAWLSLEGGELVAQRPPRLLRPVVLKKSLASVASNFSTTALYGLRTSSVSAITARWAATPMGPSAGGWQTWSSCQGTVDNVTFTGFGSNTAVKDWLNEWARGEGTYRDATINLLDPSLSQVVGSVILHGVKPVKWSRSQVLGAIGRESVEVSVGQVELKLPEQCDLDAWVAQNNAGMLAPKSFDVSYLDGVGVLLRAGTYGGSLLTAVSIGPFDGSSMQRLPFSFEVQPASFNGDGLQFGP